jgi:hypothetical protein
LQHKMMSSYCKRELTLIHTSAFHMFLVYTSERAIISNKFSFSLISLRLINILQRPAFAL